MDFINTIIPIYRIFSKLVLFQLKKICSTFKNQKQPNNKQPDNEKNCPFNSVYFVTEQCLFSKQKKAKVVLTNGSILNGYVTDFAEKNYIYLNSGSEIWRFENNEIDTIYYIKHKRIRPEIEMPWYFKIDGGLMVGNSENEESSISSIHTSFLYNIDHKIYGGGGLGVEYYMEQTYIPLFANFEYRFRQTQFTPHLYLKTGYVIPGETQHPSDLYGSEESRNLPAKYLNAKGGLLINPGFGFTSMFNQNFGFSMAIGFRHHSLSFSGKDKYEFRQNYNRLNLSLSIIFK